MKGGVVNFPGRQSREYDSSVSLPTAFPMGRDLDEVNELWIGALGGKLDWTLAGLPQPFRTMWMVLLLRAHLIRDTYSRIAVFKWPFCLTLKWTYNHLRLAGTHRDSPASLFVSASASQSLGLRACTSTSGQYFFLTIYFILLCVHISIWMCIRVQKKAWRQCQIPWSWS